MEIVEIECVDSYTWEGVHNIEQIKKEKKYQLLCANCNWIKRFENKEWGGAPKKYL